MSGYVFSPPSSGDWSAQVDELMALAAILEPGTFRVIAPAEALDLLQPPERCSPVHHGRDSGSGDDAPPDEAPDPSVLYSVDPLAGLEVQVMLHLDLGAGDGDSGSDEDSDSDAGDGAGPSTSATPPRRRGVRMVLRYGDGGGQQSASRGTLAHLPPLILQARFTPSYPSATAPEARVAGTWITAGQALLLQDMLDQCWADQGPGLPVIFAWIDAVKTQALDAILGPSRSLTVDDRLIRGLMEQRVGRVSLVGDPDAEAEAELQLSSSDAAGPGPSSGGGGVGGGSYPQRHEASGLTLEHVFMDLLSYSDRRADEVFRATNHDCPICFDEVPGPKFYRLQACGHRACRSCLSTLALTNVTEGNLEALRCVEAGCRHHLTPCDLQSLLPPEEYERWQAISLSRALDSLTDLVYCPRCKNPCLEDSDHLAQCDHCFFAFCSLCGEAFHPGGACLTPAERLELLEARTKGQAMSEAARQSVMQKKQALIHEAMSMEYVRKQTKPCPTCRIAVSKEEGCNKMTCSSCGTYFCWLCGEAIKGYEHFRIDETANADNATRCQGKLFDPETLRRWDERALGFVRPNARAAARVGGIMMQGDQGGALCPRCRQYNPKLDRNNHTRCWACGGGFCMLCRKHLIKGEAAVHYRPGGCKHHS